MRIGDLVSQTGVSRELIHHYLRQGLLPQPARPAEYGELHARLLHQIKVLRDEHHLPLEVIRSVFEFFLFEPERLEALTLADSFSKRMQRMLSSGGALSTQMLESDELARAAGVIPDEIDRYVQAGLIQPVTTQGLARYSTYDARVLGVCVHAEAQGIPFETLGTIASFVRTAFELEHSLLFPSAPGDVRSPSDMLGDVVVRLELVTSLIQSLLHGLVAVRMSDTATRAARAGTSLDGLVYRPSEAFLRRHALDQELGEAQRQLGARPSHRSTWRRTVDLLLHAGRYHEALFFSEQAAKRWPADDDVEAQHGRALLLAGRSDRGLEVLGRTARCAEAALRAAASLCLEAASGAPDLTALSNVRADAERALGGASNEPHGRRLECEMWAGWVLAALPPALGSPERGLDVLRSVLAELDRSAPGRFGLIAEKDRLLVNAAWLLYDALGLRGPRAEQEQEPLRALICRHDPGCAFAERTFQDLAAPSGTRRCDGATKRGKR